MNIYSVWLNRIENGIFTKGQCQQFTNFIARSAAGYQPFGRKTNLTGDQCAELVAALAREGGVRLTDEHTEQGVQWLIRYGHKIFGAELGDIGEQFSHFLYMGDFRVFGTYHNGTLPVWRIVLKDGREYDYWWAAWQGGEDASGFEEVAVPFHA